MLKVPSSTPPKSTLVGIGELPIEQKMEEKQLIYPQKLLTSKTTILVIVFWNFNVF